MTLKERFLEFKSYKAFDEVRDEYKDLDWVDPDVWNHYCNLIGETYKFSSVEDGVMIDFFYKAEKQEKK